MVAMINSATELQASGDESEGVAINVGYNKYGEEASAAGPPGRRPRRRRFSLCCAVTRTVLPPGFRKETDPQALLQLHKNREIQNETKECVCRPQPAAAPLPPFSPLSLSCLFPLTEPLPTFRQPMDRVY